MISKQEKKWNFDEYAWIQNYDDQMRKIERLRYDYTLDEVVVRAEAKGYEKVLDIGTGTGNLAIKFLEKGCRVVGLDPSSKLLAMAENKALEWSGRFQVKLCEDPFLKIPFPDATFNIVASTYAIHHLTDDAKRLSVREMKRVLKPGGRIVIGDVMFLDMSHKIHSLAKYPDMEDEYQPMLDSFPDMFMDEGFHFEIFQMADTVWIVRATL